MNCVWNINLNIISHIVTSLHKNVLYFSGEKIGMEYLYAQTGEVLQDYAVNPEDNRSAAIEDAMMAASIDKNEDGGFKEPEDLTVSTPDDVFLAPSAHVSTRQSALKSTAIPTPVPSAGGTAEMQPASP